MALAEKIFTYLRNARFSNFSQYKSPLIIGSVFIFLGLLAVIFMSHKKTYPFMTVRGPIQTLTVPTDLSSQLKKQDHVRGANNPQVILIEYADFECPFCKKFRPTLLEVLQDKSLQAAMVYRHFPLPFHQYAEKEAEASECVNALGGSEKFWQFHDLLYERTKSNGLGFSPEHLAPLAHEIGLDEAQVQNCINAGTYAGRVQDDIDTGKRLGVSGTPTTVIIVSSGKSQTVVGSVSVKDIKDVASQLLR